jgi:conserved hypothethical protein
MKEFREKASTIFMSIVYILFLGGWIPIYMGYDYFFVEKCSYEEIEYETLPEKEIDAGEKTTFFESDNGKKTRELDSEGRDGKKRVCKKADKVVSETVTKEPTPTTYKVYTYKYTPSKPYTPYTPAYSNYGPSALCRDGTYSYSSGRGTCSHHGGVAQWL